MRHASLFICFNILAKNENERKTKFQIRFVLNNGIINREQERS